MKAELLFIWSIFTTCFLFQNVVAYIYFSCCSKAEDDSTSEGLWNDQIWSSALLVHPHIPFLVHVQKTRVKSFMGLEVRMEMEGNKEFFCFVWSNSLAIWLKLKKNVLVKLCVNIGVYMCFQISPFFLFYSKVYDLLSCHLSFLSQTKCAESFENLCSYQK